MLTPPPTAGLPAARLDRLNTGRSLAITVVVIFHMFSTVYGDTPPNIEQLTNWPAPFKMIALAALAMITNAHLLLGFFFVMSGFALHRVFRRWRTRNQDLNGQSFARFFIWHRFWRLVPAFWVALLIAYFFAYDDPFSFSALRKLAVNAAFLKTLYPGYFFSINYAHWYVTVQWQLDLLYPAFLFVVWRRSFALAFAISCLLTLLFVFVVPAFTQAPYVTNLPFRWWAEWTLGAYVAEMHAHGRRAFPRPLLTAAGLTALLALGVWQDWAPLSWAAPRLGFALALEILVLSKSPFRGWERIIAPIGVVSYSVYLFHLIVLEQMVRLFGFLGISPRPALPMVAYGVLSFAITFAVSWLSYRYLEQKGVALGTELWRRLQSGRGKTAAAPGTPSA